MCKSINLRIPNFRSFKTLDVAYCHLDQRLQNSCARHLLKSTWQGSVQFGILETNNLQMVCTKTFLCNSDHLKPHFYIVKLGFTRVYTIFLIFVQKHRLWVCNRTASAMRF